MSTTRSASQKPAAAAAASAKIEEADHDSDEGGDDGSYSDEQDRKPKVSQTEVDDLTLDDDDIAHKPTAGAAAANALKRKAATRIGKWTDEQDLQLCAAVLKYVTAHQGQLPGAARSHKKEAAPASWKEIAADTPHCATLSDKNAAARGASNRWTSLRAGVSVRHGAVMSTVRAALTSR